MFRPTGTNPVYFDLLCSRISAAGWRPNGVFPAGVFAKGVDFSETEISYRSLDNTDLGGSSFHRANLDGCSFWSAHLSGCVFTRCQIHRSFFIHARLDDSDFSGALLIANRFNGASLLDASFNNVADLREAQWAGAANTVSVAPNDFSDAIGLNAADPILAGRDRPPLGVALQIRKPDAKQSTP
jgi:uncharacterized protein YjbI with pentapeptide repeats